MSQDESHKGGSAIVVHLWGYAFNSEMPACMQSTKQGEPGLHYFMRGLRAMQC